jgi:hypothetical protein
VISKGLTRRVGDLESHLLTAVGEPLVVRFVDAAGTVDRSCTIFISAERRLKRSWTWITLVRDPDWRCGNLRRLRMCTLRILDIDIRFRHRIPF